MWQNALLLPAACPCCSSAEISWLTTAELTWSHMAIAAQLNHTALQGGDTAIGRSRKPWKMLRMVTESFFARASTMAWGMHYLIKSHVAVLLHHALGCCMAWRGLHMAAVLQPSPCDQQHNVKLDQLVWSLSTLPMPSHQVGRPALA